MQFDPTIIIRTREGEPMLAAANVPLTVGRLAVHALDTATGFDARDMYRMFHLASAIKGAADSSAPCDLKPDEVELVSAAVARGTIPLVWGQFRAAIDAMKAGD